MRHNLARAMLIALSALFPGTASAQNIGGSTKVAGSPDSAFASFVAFLKTQHASIVRSDAGRHRVEAKVTGTDETIVYVFSKAGDSTTVAAQGAKGSVAAMIYGLGAVNDWIDARSAHPAPAPPPPPGPPSSQALADALAQIRAHRLDSATVLLQHIATKTGADSSERAVAYMWLGVTSFYRGQDSVATNEFHHALEMNPLLTASSVLARLDSGLAVTWENAQTTALCGQMLPAWIWATPMATGDALNVAARGGQPPAILGGSAAPYPENLRLKGIQGRVVARAIIDSAGRAEPGSVRIISTPDTGFNGPMTEYFQKANYTPHARACVVLPVDFSIRR